MIDRENYEFSSASVERLTYFDVRNVMPPKASDFFHQMVIRRGGISDIALVEQAEKRPNGRRN